MKPNNPNYTANVAISAKLVSRIKHRSPYHNPNPKW
uniref:Uncharacterized protein n=1 Tax=Arundo donax TaxID=35708 RepID=A0A0A8YHW0_ARUDO